MAFKFVVLCALFVATYASSLVAPISYTQHQKGAIANPSVNAFGSTQQNVVRSFSGNVLHYSKALNTPYSSVQKDNTPVNNNVYTSNYAKSVQYTAPVYSAPGYSAPTYSTPIYPTYQALSYDKKVLTQAPYTYQALPTPSAYSGKESSTTTEATTESTTTLPETTENPSPESRSAENIPEPTPAISSGYRYEAPKTSSFKIAYGVPTVFTYAAPAQSVASYNAPAPASNLVKYDSPAQVSGKYRALAPPVGNYAVRVFTGPTPVNVKYTAPVSTIVRYSAPQPTAYTKDAVPESAQFEYLQPPTANTAYGAPASTVYTQYGAPTLTAYAKYDTQSQAFTKYAAPIPNPTVNTKYGAPGSTLKYGALSVLLKHEAEPSTAPNESAEVAPPTPITENRKDSQIENEETVSTTNQENASISYQSPTTHQAPANHQAYQAFPTSYQAPATYQTSATYQASASYRAPTTNHAPAANQAPASYQATTIYQAPATYQDLTTYQAPSSYHDGSAGYQRQESARSISNESNGYSNANAVSHVSFDGFGTHYGY